MKYILIAIIMLFTIHSSLAQNKNNNLELGTSIYNFNNTNTTAVSEINIAYTRQLSHERWAIRIGSGFFYKEYSPEGEIILGTVFDRYFFYLETTARYNLINHKQSKLDIHFGPIYRMGTENQVVKIINRDIWNEIVTYEFSNSGLGGLITTNYSYYFSFNWNINCELGVHQYLRGDGTTFDTFGRLKIGYAF